MRCFRKESFMLLIKRRYGVPCVKRYSSIRNNNHTINAFIFCRRLHAEFVVMYELSLVIP